MSLTLNDFSMRNEIVNLFIFLFCLNKDEPKVCEPDFWT